MRFFFGVLIHKNVQLLPESIGSKCSHAVLSRVRFPSEYLFSRAITRKHAFRSNFLTWSTCSGHARQGRALESRIRTGKTDSGLGTWRQRRRCCRRRRRPVGHHRRTAGGGGMRINGKYLCYDYWDLVERAPAGLRFWLVNCFLARLKESVAIH